MSHKTKIIKGSASNLLRVALSMLLAFILPRLLVHRLSPAEYSAWVLILQISAYISLLDLGLQTAVGKLVAEYDAVGDRFACCRTLAARSRFSVPAPLSELRLSPLSPGRYLNSFTRCRPG
jgi:hypothetical protein